MKLEMAPDGGPEVTRTDVELLFFEGCPHVEVARRNLRSALEAAGAAPSWKEWDLAADETPERYRRHGSPTVLVDGEDVTGGPGDAAAMACRANGAPTVEEISRRLG